MATDQGDSQEQVSRLVLTEEEKAVLRECRRNSILFRGLPLAALSVFLTRQFIKRGLSKYAKKHPALYYTGVVAVSFLGGIESYRETCMRKIMRLDNSRLADQVRAYYDRSGTSSPYERAQSGRSFPEQQNAEGQGHFRSPDATTANFSRYEAGDYSASPTAFGSSARDQGSASNEEAPPPPSLYFEVDKAKENKSTSYKELRKKHRERWSAPNVSSGRREQSKHRHEDENDSRTSEALISWPGRDNEEETGGETEQRSARRQSRTPYRQGQPAKKNKYGDVIE